VEGGETWLYRPRVMATVAAAEAFPGDFNVSSYLETALNKLLR
jgi:uncharacterized protein YqcC (DUF446 family)